MADEKLTDLTALDAFASGDLLYTVDDPAGTPVSKKATIDQVQDYIESAANTFTAKQTIDLAGEQLALGGTNTGVMSFAGTTSGKVTLQAADAAGTYTLTLPTNDGDSGQFLKTDGSGVLSWDAAGGGGTPGGSDTQVQFNDGGAFGGDADFTWDKTANLLTLGADASVRRRAAANLQLGAADAAAPVAQTLSVQSVVAGTTNTAGANLTIAGSQGTGTGAGGSIVFQVAPAGTTGTAQNALVAGATLAPSGTGAALTLAGGTVTTDSPVLNLTQTWNDAAVTFTGLKFNVTNTASAATSSLLDLLVNSARVALVDRAGYFRSVGVAQLSDTNNRITLSGNNQDFHLNNNVQFSIRIGQSYVPSGGSLGCGTDTRLFRDDANIFAQRNGTNAQTFRVYNTFTSATSFERAKIAWSSNVLQIGTEKGADGGTARALELQTDGTTRLTIATDGAATFSTSVSTPTVTASSTAANTSAIASTGYSLTGSSAVSLVDLAGTWNTTGTPTLIKANVTDTASDAGSLLMDLQVGGTSKAKIDKDGDVTTTGSVTTAAPAGGTAAAWKLGARVADTTTLDTTQYIEVDVGGTLYKLALVTV